MSLIQNAIEKRWYSRPGCLLAFVPFEKLFISLAMRRRRQQQVESSETSAPVVVVGNISVGGTGKTPLLIALAQMLKSKGFSPGIVSRGYGRKKNSTNSAANGDSEAGFPDVVRVSQASTVADVGDEPLLIFEATACPLAVCTDRQQAVAYLRQTTDCDVILSDDGMQHYGMARDLEIAVVDGARGLGNTHCLPVGPLREEPRRLNDVDWVVVNGGADKALKQLAAFDIHSPLVAVDVEAVSLTRLIDGKTFSLTDKLPSNGGLGDWLAVAGLGNPSKFFNTLKKLGWRFEPRTFPDHHAYTVDDFLPFHNRPLVMTTKDAVKCRPFAREHWYQLNVSMGLPEEFSLALVRKLKALQV